MGGEKRTFRSHWNILFPGSSTYVDFFSWLPYKRRRRSQTRQNEAEVRSLPAVPPFPRPLVLIFTETPKLSMTPSQPPRFRRCTLFQRFCGDTVSPLTLEQGLSHEYLFARDDAYCVCAKTSSPRPDSEGVSGCLRKCNRDGQENDAPPTSPPPLPWTFQRLASGDGMGVVLVYFEATRKQKHLKCLARMKWHK